MTRTIETSTGTNTSRNLGGKYLTFGLAQFRKDARTLEAREVVDENLALEMIHFMLDTHRQEAFRFEFEYLALHIECANPHALCPRPR